MDGNSYASHSNICSHELSPSINKGEKEKDPSNNAYLPESNIVDAPNVCANETGGDLIPSLNCGSENSSELRRRRDDLNYPPRYPDLQHTSLPEVRNSEKHIDISPMDFGFVSDSDDDSDETDEFHDKPRYTILIKRNW